MVRCLVLGSEAIGHEGLISMLRLIGELQVIDADEGRIETLRDNSISAIHGDPGNPDLFELENQPDLALVASAEAETNLRAVKAVRAKFDDIHVIAISGEDNVSLRSEIERISDRYVDSIDETTEAILTVGTGKRGVRFAEFAQTIRTISGRLGVFMHTDPDPDAIGSALALRDIARMYGVNADACYFGEISHQENQALVNLLDLDLHHLEGESFEPDTFEGYALVDHSRPGVNDRLSRDVDIDIVIDHHPPRGPVDGRFLDLRTDVGATSTILVDYLDALSVDVDNQLATALLFGIRVDTRDFGRDITVSDFEAASRLLPLANMDVLERVEGPSITGDTLDTIGQAIKGYERAGSVVVSSAGRIRTRDSLAQAADRLLGMKDVTLSVAFGILDDVVHVSARTRASDLDVGELMRRAFADLGSAGGHADMAGAQLSIGILGDVRIGEESLEDVIETIIRGRLYEELDLEWATQESNIEALVGDLQAETDSEDGDESF